MLGVGGGWYACIQARSGVDRLQARRQQIQQVLLQLERQMVQARLQVITVEQRIARLTRSQRPAA
jgi:hypothetical protein